MIFQWEHVTFTSGDDCATTLSIVKTPDNATFNIGDQLTFTLVVKNTGHDTAIDVQLDDPLPTTGGLTWSVFSTSAGSCTINASQVLHCDLGNLAPSASATVVVKSSNANGAPAAVLHRAEARQHWHGLGFERACGDRPRRLHVFAHNAQCRQDAG